ncbi:phospholipase C [Stachybotrys elegans]|uniref:Phospholipase C n=1 Tax=Stachybotrys elegans TaxID=80388 RepID=A0A8K0SZ76_9HYPO|nr:phospholipase C [Stachybotrys elegans]
MAASLKTTIPRALLPPPRRQRPLSTLLLLVLLASVSATGLLHLLLSLAPCLGRRDHCYNSYYSPYSFDAAAADRSRWMEALPDAANLSSLSIPGTHDTLTHAAMGEHLQCQNSNLSAQLRAGVRYIDVRARLRDDALHVYHADGDTGVAFEDVLLDAFAFLDANPSEAIVMRLKEESAPVGHNNSFTFEEAFNWHRLEAPATAAGAAKHLRLYDPAAGEPLPTLGALRSGVFLLQNFKAPSGAAYGLAWEGPQMALQDMWIIPDVYHLADKWTAVRTSLERATTEPDDNSRLYLSHLSASVGVLPIEAAAGPLNRTVDGINDLTGQWLRDFEHSEEAVRTGIVIMDFPGKELVDAVLAWNAPLLQ